MGKRTMRLAGDHRGCITVDASSTNTSSQMLRCSAISCRRALLFTVWIQCPLHHKGVLILALAQHSMPTLLANRYKLEHTFFTIE